MSGLMLAKANLPPLWDGARVEWELEGVPAEVFICPPPRERERCAECGSTDAPELWRGLRHPMPGETFESTRVVTGRFGRTLDRPVQVPAWAAYDLTAFRCLECRHDEVWDMRADEWWGLEPADYGPDGSSRPSVSGPTDAEGGK